MMKNLGLPPLLPPSAIPLPKPPLGSFVHGLLMPPTPILGEKEGLTIAHDVVAVELRPPDDMLWLLPLALWFAILSATLELL